MLCFVIMKAVIVRVIFALHGFISIWRVTDVTDDDFFWILALAILGLIIESLFTIVYREGREWKWFCPSVFFYLASVVPSIWLLELDRLDRRIAVREGFNLSLTSASDSLDKIEYLGISFELPIQLSPETWVLAIEQLLLFILIIGRWMLPKGDLSRDQLSQLLLVYIGTAADIIEFFETFKEETVRYDVVLTIVILSIWTWSLFQFTLVLTAAKSRKSRLGTIIPKESSPYNASCAQTCCTTNVWGILMSLFFQDVPFLCLRLCLIFKYNVISYMHIFFTSKNTLVIFMQVYRLFVLNCEKRKPEKPQVVVVVDKSKVPIRQDTIRDDGKANLALLEIGEGGAAMLEQNSAPGPTEKAVPVQKGENGIPLAQMEDLDDRIIFMDDS